ncbi:unnamed protein product, partial [Gulo gulo]
GALRAGLRLPHHRASWLFPSPPGGQASTSPDQQRGLLRERRFHAHDPPQLAFRRSGCQWDGQLPWQVLLRHLLPPPRLPAAPPRAGEDLLHPLPALLASQLEDAAGGHGGSQLQLYPALSPAHTCESAAPAACG